MLKNNLTYLEKVFGILLKNRIEGKMEQMSMLISSVMIEVNEVFNVVMRTNVLDILRRPKLISDIWNLNFLSVCILI